MDLISLHRTRHRLSQSHHQLKLGTAFSQVRPTRLDEIKNLHHYFRFGGVIVHLPASPGGETQPGATGSPSGTVPRRRDPADTAGSRRLCRRVALLRAIRDWPVDNEGAAPTHFARPDLATASTTGGSQRLNREGRQTGAGRVLAA